MNSYKKYAAIFIGVLALVFTINSADAANLLKSDKRIKTFVYNQNEVYTVIAKNSFQTALEFAEDEKIETISLGDPVGWRITNSGRRVFVKPIHTKGTTNLSVFTNKRSYQFELVAAGKKDSRSNHSYIVRFFYPNSSGITKDDTDRTRNSLRPVSNTHIPRVPTFPQAAPRAPIVPQAPVVRPAPAAPVPAVNNSAAQLNNFNFNYTLSGPEVSAPKKIFDDGRSTYFEFTKPMNNVKFAVLNPQGKATPIPASHKKTPAGSVYIVGTVTRKFSVTSGNQIVHVYNEQTRSLPPTNLATGRTGARF